MHGIHSVLNQNSQNIMSKSLQRRYNIGGYQVYRQWDAGTVILVVEIDNCWIKPYLCQRLICISFFKLLKYLYCFQLKRSTSDFKPSEL